MNCTVHPESAAISYCRTCGKPMCETCRRNVRGTYYCEECIANRLQDAMPPAGATPPIPPPMTPRSHAPSPGLAAVLGFIPGVGAMYNGQFAKALIHVVVFVSIIWFTSNVSGVVGGIFIPFFVFYMVFEAYKTAHARELGLPLPDPFGLENLFGGGAPQHPPMPPVPPVAPPPVGAPGTGEPGNPNVAGFVPGNPAASGQSAEQYWQNYPQNLGNQIRGDVYEGMRQQDIAARRSNAAPIGAVILIVLGALFLLDNIGLWHFNFDRFWPLILIAIGIWLLIRRLGLLESHGKEQR
jgi:TM2 domain-containing membrane protein YozV